jgi:hypothetical protein
MTSRGRMWWWLAAGLALYGASIAVGIDYPQVQTGLWKAGHVTTFAWIGYRIACRAVGRVNWTSSASLPPPGYMIARAIIIAAAMIAGSHGL